MKHKGCIVDFSVQRNRELMRAYRSVLSKKSHFDFKNDYNEVVNHPCSRFWVSEERATVVVSALLKGHYALDSMHPLKREMFLEIFKRFMEIYEENPNRSIPDIVFEVVNSSAPKFYMTPRTAMMYIYSIKKNHHPKRNIPFYRT